MGAGVNDEGGRAYLVQDGKVYEMKGRGVPNECKGCAFVNKACGTVLRTQICTRGDMDTKVYKIRRKAVVG